MKRMIAMIARVLAAIPIVVAVWSVDLGRFILTSAGWLRPADPVDLVDEYVEAVENVPVTPAPDQRLTNIQAAAEALFRHQPVTGEMVSGLSEHTLAWLEALNADMLLAVTKAKPTDLKEHLAGRKSIRGLLAADPDSVAAYVEAVRAEADRPAKRRTRKLEPLMPAFGPIC